MLSQTLYLPFLLCCRKNFDDDSIGGSFQDDASTSRASDDGYVGPSLLYLSTTFPLSLHYRTVYSYSLHSRAPVSTAVSAVISPPEKSYHQQQKAISHSSSSSASSTFSSLATHGHGPAGGVSSPGQLGASFRSSVKTVSSIQLNATKLFGNLASSVGEAMNTGGGAAPAPGAGNTRRSEENDLKVDRLCPLLSIPLIFFIDP